MLSGSTTEDVVQELCNFVYGSVHFVHIVIL